MNETTNSNGEDKPPVISPILSRCALEAIQYAYGRAMSPAMPCDSLYRYFYQQAFNECQRVPKLMFTVFNGGKALGSKVKFSKFYVIIDVQPTDPDEIDANILHYKIFAAIKKSLNVGKTGEAAFKPNATGSYFNALDSHNDTFKLLEDAINSVGVNTADRKYLSIGVNADLAQFYLPE